MTTTTITTTTTHEGEYHDSSTINNASGAGIPEIPINKATYRFVWCAALNSCNLGYDIGVSTVASKLVQDDWNLSDVQREVLVSSINFWASTYVFVSRIF